MKPHIHYAKSSDGANIAYATIGGEGDSIVVLPMLPYSHLEKQVDNPLMGQILQQYASYGRATTYDNRGSGLSDREADDYSLEAHLHDLEAVIDAIGADEIVLIGRQHSSPIAIAFAARHPERVSKLVLVLAYARGSDYLTPALEAALQLMEADWETFVETAPRTFLGWESEELAKPTASFFRDAVTPEVASAIYQGIRTFDVSGELANVAAPTLIVHYDIASGRMDPKLARELAAAIPDCTLVVENTLVSTSAVREFLGSESGPSASPSGDVHTILFTDIEGSTTLADRLGDGAAQDIRRTHNEIVRGALASQGGTEVKHTGDGIMASFSTASAALEAAIAIQRGVAEHNAERPDSPLGVYVGLNAGEPIAEEGDLFGTSINLAARICDHAQPGQVLAADVVRQLAAGKDFRFSDVGETELRGFEDPVKLWELRWEA